MKAIVYTEFGAPDVLRVEEVEEPIPADNEALVRVQAVSINFGDVSFVRGKPLVVRLMGAGLLRPTYTTLGSDIAGRVVAIGKSVRQVQPGDEVYGDLSESGWGGWAEYASVPEQVLAPKPANLTFEQAAAVPQAATVALQGLRDVGQIRPGQSVLIYGASGGIGTFAVQMAKLFGAEVTGVCSTRNLEMVRSIGADHVIDYTREDFAQSDQRYDLIMATAGYRSLFDYRRALNPQGIYVMAGGAMAQVFQALLLGPWASKKGQQQLTNLASKPSRKDLLFIKDQIESGKLLPVVDRCYAFDEIADAARYYAEGHARGKVIVRGYHNGHS